MASAAATRRMTIGTSGMAARLGRRTFRLGDRIGLRTAQPGLRPVVVTLL
jgi:hypothetical protein